ncbi:MAG: acetyl-CoA carboxylase biotin carboxylase subunit, partial [Steroidobacteraceae bacterium]
TEASWPAGPGVRVDTHIASGSRVPPFYDSLMAKIIAHAASRGAALARLREAIVATRIEGVATNLSFHAAVLADPEFQAGGVDTGYLTRLLERARIPGTECAPARASDATTILHAPADDAARGMEKIPHG